MKKITRQKVDCYSRVVGYLSPVRLWNPGKKQEFKDRKVFRLDTEKRKVEK